MRRIVGHNVEVDIEIVIDMKIIMDTKTVANKKSIINIKTKQTSTSYQLTISNKVDTSIIIGHKIT